MEVSSRCQQSLTTLQVWKCITLSIITHHSTVYRYGSVCTFSAITHHSTGLEVSALIKGASGQPSLTSDHSSGMEAYSNVTHHRRQRSTITHQRPLYGYGSVQYCHSSQFPAVSHYSPLYRSGRTCHSSKELESAIIHHCTVYRCGSVQH
jgi:hypothetical protein